MEWTLSNDEVHQRMTKIQKKISNRLRVEFRKVAMDTRNTETPFILQQKMTKYFCATKLALAKGKVKRSPRSREVPKDLQYTDHNLSRKPEHEFMYECYKTILLNNQTYKFSHEASNILVECINESLREEDSNRPHLNVPYMMLAYFRLHCYKVRLRASMTDMRKKLTHGLRSLLDALTNDVESQKDEFSSTVRQIAKCIYKLSFELDSTLLCLKDFCEGFDTAIIPSPETYEKPEDIDDIGPVSEDVFIIVVEAKIPVRMTLSLEWAAFNKWNLSYLLKEEGHAMVNYKSTKQETTQSCLFIYILDLKRRFKNFNLDDYPILLHESFKDHQSLYDDCIPRPFPDLKNFWIDAVESIFIMIPHQSYTFGHSRRFTLLIQIFGTTLVELLDSESSKATTLIPRQALLFPPRRGCVVVAESACALKRYQWAGDPFPKKGIEPAWINKTDTRYAQLRKRHESLLIKKSKSTSKEAAFEIPSEAKPNSIQSKQTLPLKKRRYIKEPSDTSNPADCRRRTKSKRRKAIQCNKRHLTMTKIMCGLRKCDSNKLKQFAHWLIRREGNIRRREAAVASRERLLKEKELSECSTSTND